MSTDNDASDSQGTLGMLVGDTGVPFAIVAFGLPIAAAIIAIGLRHGGFLNFVHVVSGAVWAGAAVFLTGILAPTLARFDQELRGQVNVSLIPKNVLLFSGVAAATLLTGPVLAVEFGLWDLSNPYLVVGVLIGTGLLIAAIYVLSLQVTVFREVRLPGPPDQERITAIADRLSQAGPVILALQLAALVVMAFLRTGGI